MLTNQSNARDSWHEAIHQHVPVFPYCTVHLTLTFLRPRYLWTNCPGSFPFPIDFLYSLFILFNYYYWSYFLKCIAIIIDNEKKLWPDDSISPTLIPNAKGRANLNVYKPVWLDCVARLSKETKRC